MNGFKTDGVTLSVFRSHVVAAAEGMGHTVERSSHSTFVKESDDFATAIATPAGEFFSYPRNIGVSSFLGLDLKPAIDALATCRPGDVLVTNDPYSTQGLVTHLPDIHLIKPIFAADELICFVWCFIHSSDVGGLAPASISPLAEEIHQEGFRLPPRKLCDEGTLDQELLDLILTNTRSPTENFGDIKAMIGALNTGERRMQETIAKFGLDVVHQAMDDMLLWTENRARARLATIPDGDYHFIDYLDDDGDGAPVRLAVMLRARGDTVELDFSGTDPQVRIACNLPAFGPRHPFLAQGIINFILSEEPDIPLTGAIMRPITIVAPRGSILNPEYPAAVGVRYATVIRLYNVVLGALAQAIPDRVPSAGSGAAAVVMVSVPNRDSGGRQVAVLEPLQGGGGATKHADGVAGNDSAVGFLRNTPVESLEANVPVVVEKYELIPGSAGAGMRRGGWGTRLDFRLLRPHSIVTAQGMERCLFEPWGLAGGLPSARTQAFLNRGTPREQELGQIGVLTCDPGDVVSVLTSGGGGYGDPLTRDVDDVWADHRAGLLTIEDALAHYGAVIGTDGVDQPATAATREARRPSHAAERRLFAFGQTRIDYELVWTEELSDALCQFLYTLPTGLRPFAKRELRQKIASATTRPTPGAVAGFWQEIATTRLANSDHQPNRNADGSPADNTPADQRLITTLHRAPQTGR
jgi:N-methylhydantoinase B